MARSFLREASCPEHAAHVLDDALLLVSEAVANAVRHGAPPIVVAVDCDESRGHAGPGARRQPAPAACSATADPLDEGGRGVQLIDLLSAAWGVEDVPEGGKAVWFVLPPSPRLTAGHERGRPGAPGPPLLVPAAQCMSCVRSLTPGSPASAV